jgi:integrase
VQVAFRRVVERSGLLDARIHDLRRSFGTYCGKLKIQPHVIDALLNHAPVTITRKHYNLWDYSDEKRDALVRWERYLIDDLISGGKVIALPARA